MSLIVLTRSLTASGVTGLDLGSANDGFVGVGVTLDITGAAGIAGLGDSGHDVWVNGTVTTTAGGIVLGQADTAGGNHHIEIGATGIVSSSAVAIGLYGGGSSILNDGNIYSIGYGILLENRSGATVTVDNTGIIAASQAISRVFGDENGRVDFTNTGRIYADYSYTSSANGTAVDQVINRGLMVGLVDLGGGNDVFDTVGGRVIGDIYGGAGNDLFRPGAQVESITGDAGNDTLDFSPHASITVALDGAFANLGAARNDSYAGIEIVIGTAGSDRIGGDANGNLLRGNGGVDVLSGQGGNDTLQGGAGADRLNGGAGNDFFQIMALAERADVIQDFTNVAGNNDTLRLEGSGFGFGAATGALAASQFRARADNVAQDADDRFIFRTTDTTLWFDANGNAAGGLSLLADLQAGATLTAADFLLV
jgi:Ca2+-binding RTX toxin-like protein